MAVPDLITIRIVQNSCKVQHSGQSFLSPIQCPNAAGSTQRMVQADQWTLWNFTQVREPYPEPAIRDRIYTCKTVSVLPRGEWHTSSRKFLGSCSTIWTCNQKDPSQLAQSMSRPNNPISLPDCRAILTADVVVADRFWMCGDRA